MPHDIGMDLGTSTVLIYVKGKGVVLEEPSVVAIDTETGNLKSVGSEAAAMIGRTPPHILAVCPMQDGVICQYDLTLKMIQFFLQKAGGAAAYKPRMVICVPSGITEVEERALVDAATQAGASKAYLIEEPIAAALGAGIDIYAPKGSMVVDIGGGTTDVAVISMGGIVVSDSVKIAGNKFDDAIIRFMRKEHNLAIGEKTAESVKKTIGTVVREGNTEKTLEIRGRGLLEGLPSAAVVTGDELSAALEEPLSGILDMICKVIEQVPTELLADISSSGIVLTGGGAQLNGFAKRVSQRTGLPCKVAEDPVHCVVKGTGLALNRIQTLSNSSRSGRNNKHKN
ncbi:MAG: rod shape-determining protein [Clostridia bacterium]|nr:rod shape-determining protein [Clostridia bacterium]